MNQLIYTEFRISVAIGVAWQLPMTHMLIQWTSLNAWYVNMLYD